MGSGFRRITIFGLVISMLLMVAPLVGAQERANQGRDCSLTSTGAIPISDLGVGTYDGVQGGLYPDGSNTIPEDHATLGLWHASQIEPLDAQGNPDPDGEIVVVSLGVSNTWREFDDFTTVAAGRTAPSVAFVNGAQAGMLMQRWVDPQDATWSGVELALQDGGVTNSQVQVAWVKMVAGIRTWDELEPFPTDAEQYQADLEQVLRTAKDRYPNLQIAYISSRIYGGYSTNASPSPEPLAYENGYGVKWTIERQISGAPELNHDPRSGPVEVPWIAWGPYIWADGTEPRSDGLTWDCSDFRNDGTHPTESGIAKVGNMLLDHFLSAPTSAPWFSVDGEPVEVGELPEVTRSRTTTTVADPDLETTTTERQRRSRTRERTTTTSTTSPVSTSDPGGDPGSEIETPEARGSDTSPSDPASSALVLVAAVLVVAASLGGAALIITRRNTSE